uniref:Uncharacterized protein n=1 Tax=Anguilla anguilla TaxID=7936 RepID=A0A0E9RUH5_ANGAN
MTTWPRPTPPDPSCHPRPLPPFSLLVWRVAMRTARWAAVRSLSRRFPAGSCPVPPVPALPIPPAVHPRRTLPRSPRVWRWRLRSPEQALAAR